MLGLLHPVVDDDMESIMRLANTEGMLFKFGSGTGTDLSTPAVQQGEALRRRHALGAGVSFMRVYDAIASVVKSGARPAAPPRCRP